MMRTPAEVRAANRLWSLRQRAGLSRRALCERLAADPEEPWSIHPNTLSAIEKGQRSFPFDQADIFARALGVPIGDVLWNRIPPPEPWYRLPAVLRHYPPLMTDYAEQFRAAQAAERRYPNWFAVTAEINFDTLLPTTTRHALQIGAFTGDASLAILTRCPGAHLTDVDTWTGSPQEQIHSAFDWEDVLDTYLRRTAPYADRLTVHRTTSDAFFAAHPADAYDFIYIDGSHETEQVARDADNAHARLTPDGILAFDDYLWGSPDYDNAPRPAIDVFHAAHRDQYDVLAVNAQVWLRRR